jgi:hypothetical protein
MATLRLTIEGEPRSISLRTFFSALDNWLAMLRDLDGAISHEVEQSLDWVVSDLSLGSLAVTVESRSRLEEKNVGPEVAHAFVSGLNRIEQEGASPPYLSEEGMKRARRLLRLIGRDGAFGIVATDYVDEARVSARAAASIDQLLPVRRKATGSVEGMLETVSLRGRKPRFVVYQHITRKAVGCLFTREEWLEKVKEALGRRVSVHGIVHYNAKGEPVRIGLEGIRVLREREELPTTDEMAGSQPDLTGEMTTDEFIRSIRG